MRSRGVTVFLEPKFLYNYRPAAASKPPDDFIIPFGKAKVRRQGTDVTVVAYGTAVHWALQAAEEVAREGISTEVIDLRSLAPWDKRTVLESVRKTNRVIVAHEDKRAGGFGGEVAAVIAEEGFQYLDAPVVRLGSKDCPIGFAKPLEQAIMLQPGEIAEAIRRLVRY
jgi:2-oxoisovalerate dehydrogenase E1 component